MAGEKFKVDVVANVKGFLASMAKATKAMKTMGDMNRGIIKNFQGMSSASKKFGQKFGQTRQKMKNGITNVDKAAKKSTSTFKKYFKVFAVGAGSIGLATTSLLLFRKAFRAAAEAEEIQVQARAFANLTASYGENSQVLLRELKSASKETLNLMQVMTTASRAILLGINTSKLVDLMKVARAAAKAMGTTAAGAFSDISLGIGRQSRLILDNLGIIVKVGPAYDRYAKAIGTTASALTDFEKKQAFQNAVIEAGQDIVDRSATGLIDFQDRIAQLRVTVKEFVFLFGANILAAFQTLIVFLERSGLGKKFKEIFEVGLPKVLIISVEKLSGVLTKIDLLLDSIEKKGKKQTVIDITINAAKDFGGIFDTEIGILGVAAKELNKGLNSVISIVRGKKTKIFPTGKPDKPSSSIQGILSVINKPIQLDFFGKSIESSEEKVKSLKETFEEFLRLNKIGLLGGQQTRSDLQLAEDGIKSLRASLEDTSVSAQDLARIFSQKIPVIEKGISSVGPPTRELSNALVELNKELKETVTPEAFLEGIGVLSEKRFIKQATQDIEKFQRVLKTFKENSTIVDPEVIIKARKEILKLVDNSVEALDGPLREQLQEINLEMEKIVPNDSIQRGLNQWVDNFKSTKDRLTQLGVSLANNLSSGLDNFFFDTITGKLTSLQSAFNSLFQSILRSMTRFLADKATNKFFELIGFGGTKTATGKGTTAIGLLSKASSFVKGLFGGSSPNPTSVVGTSSTGSSLNTGGVTGGVGGVLSALTSLPKVFGFAKGGITSLAGIPNSGMVAKQPTLAAIAEKPGSSEAIVPLDKFASLIKPTNINISAIDTQSFAEFVQ
ncbi:hypothetical protein HOB87_08010, partial [Candidatus Woesearchaeota archaeon]|nr:hypothetical protein [Candidatus Woesearchaeota archaeon]